ncbi:MAG: type II toxin-antitoxin system VapC family toxin [Prosthecobacter sp.]|nr:type II toxin-antitoxin system VapC family toxin [Prosthecobacter sp.]
MSYLVDTNVYSEPLKPKPEPRVVAWLREHEGELYVSTVTIGEIRRGIERLPEGKRKTQLRAWLQALCDCMKGRVLSYNTSTAHVWGQLKAKWDKAGFVIPSLDSQIAATAQRHSLIVVTRNVRDFEKTGIRVLNPFADIPADYV